VNIVACCISMFFVFLNLCEAKSTQPILLMTVPKAGSHLMIKTLYFLTEREPLWHEKQIPTEYTSIDSRFLYTHLCVAPKLESQYSRMNNLKKILLIRDLRDVVISMVYHVRKNPLWPGMTAQQREMFSKMAFSDQLLFMINFEYDERVFETNYRESLQVSLVRVAEQVFRYSKNPDILTIRYEDLVGPNGGGTLEAQMIQMKKINNFLKLKTPEGVLYQIASQLYGNELDPFGQKGFKNFRSTFRSGKIRQWKEVFTEEHKVAFKKKVGKILIALGYEEDDDW